jgi:hypothetical protein
MLGGVPKILTTFAVVVSMTASPALATAAAAPAAINPMIALSIFGSQASAAALCGSGAASAAGAAVTAQAPAGGCVLPLVDAPPPPPIVEAPPFVPAPVSGGFGISPILLGLAGIAILAALIASQDDDDDDSPPVSVN